MGRLGRGLDRDETYGLDGRRRRRARGNEHAATTKTQDELELSYRLESETGSVLKEGKSTQKGNSDGEDLLTSLIEHAAEEIAGVVAK